MKPDYQRHAETGVWERPDGTHVTYADGAESRILKLVRDARDLGTLSGELAAAISDWPTEYHFSRSRHCLLRPLDIQPGARVLELGCGCGALTRYLGECGARVDAVEGSRPRAQIAAARCRDLPTVAVYLDDLAGFSSPATYDWVLLIGVLEYAPAYSSSPDPVGDYLAHAAQFLSPGGRLVVAIENKLGLKYFNGCSEDHIGRPFYGIQGLYADKEPVTFGKQELTEYLVRTGFGSVGFAYPFPDYKLPDVVLTDAAFASPDFPVTDFLFPSLSRDYQSPTPRPFHEALVRGELVANGLLADFANSFLAVAAKADAPTFPPPSGLAWRFDVHRAPHRATQTDYKQTSNGIVASRRLLAPAPHAPSMRVGSHTIDQLTEFAPPARHPWPDLDFLRAFARHGALEPCIPTLIPWFRWLGSNAQSGQIDGRFFDTTPFAPPEWGFHRPIPLGWVLARTVQRLLKRAAFPCASADVFTVIRELFRAENGSPSIEATEIEQGLRLESEFQYRLQEGNHGSS